MVYLVTCKTIKAMYRGHNGHKEEIRNRTTPLGRHFNTCGLDNYSLQLIDRVRNKEN
jgi:hypothetical protein